MEHLSYVLASFFIAMLFTLMFIAFFTDFYESKKIKSYQKEIELLKEYNHNLELNLVNSENKTDMVKFENSLLKKEIEEIKRK